MQGGCRDVGMRRIILCAAIGVTLLTMGLPGEARALTLGPTAPPASFGVSAPVSETAFNTDAPAGVQLTAPANGVITRFRTAADEPVTLRVLRKSGANYIGAGTGPQVTPLGTGIVVTTETHLPIAMGDTIGIDAPAGTQIGGFSVGTTWAVSATQPPVPDGGPPQPAGSFGPAFVYVNADFEPDEDGDGFGDVSQDQCLGQGGTSNGCLPPAAVPTAAPTGRQAAAIKKCKKKAKKKHWSKKQLKKCKKQANKLPV
jgi:hypothetical protein